MELVAGPPLVDRPISGSFDDQGRLYVTDSSGSNEKPDKQLEAKPHRVVRLDDTDGDGKFDKTTVFADKLMFPEGCLWYDGAVYVSAVPSIWKLTDTNNDGVADVRVEWHEGKTVTGCANDLHGPYVGPDGWIYWCKGAFASQTYRLPDGQTFTSRASHIFRARPDHSGLEPVLTGGMDNPVGLAFTPEGERILCGTFFVRPEAGKRDGLIHAIYGGVYGKPHDALEGHKRTGDLMPVMTLMSAAAPASVIRYESQTFGKEFQNNLFTCLFNMHKVTRHVLEPNGATFKTKDSDFLVSDNTDFHPTDVIEDADGSLLVLDTGGWYKICCPTSQLSKPDLLGAIYRIRRKGAPKVDDPRGLKIAWRTLNEERLAKLLADTRPVVLKRALNELGKRGPAAIPAINAEAKRHDSPDVRQNAVWALTRIDDPKARSAVRELLKDRNEGVRHAAAHSVSVWRDREAVKGLIALKDDSTANRRVVAEALGRIGDTNAISMLLSTFADYGPLDRVHEHSLLYALIEIGDAEAVASEVWSDNIYVRQAAVMALDQMGPSALKVHWVTPLLDSETPEWRKTGYRLANHHPEWGDELADFFHKKLLQIRLNGAEIDELKPLLAQFSHSQKVQKLIADELSRSGVPERIQELLLQVIASTSSKTPPASWTDAVAVCLKSRDDALVRAAVGAARALGHSKALAPGVSDALLDLASHGSPDLRFEAFCARPGTHTVTPEFFALIGENLESSMPVTTRNSAAAALTRSKLTDDQLLVVSGWAKSVGPLELPKVLAMFGHATNEVIGLKLLAALSESKSRAGLRPDDLKAALAKCPASVQEKGKELLASLNTDAPKQSAHLDELLPTVKDGDIRRGQSLFNSPKLACSTCHSMGYGGGKLGPDLTKIGEVRTERDLLEAIVYPSASFVRSYEPFTVTKKDDEQVSGILRKDAPDEVVLATGPDTEVHIARADITGLRPGTVSIMPGGLEDIMSRQDLADLVAFLKATKWGPR